jgi:hypothetical protein
MAFGNTWNNEAIIGNVSCAVLFIHAAKDRTVPMEHSATLFQKCRSRKLLITPETMEHNSHLFADPQFLAVPAIHFFHFPCYQTNNPPTLPLYVFKSPQSLQRDAGCKTPWSCHGRVCTNPHGEEEVAVPVGTVVLGEVDVSDKANPSRIVAQTGLTQRHFAKGMDSALENVQGELDSQVNLNPPRFFTGTSAQQVAPGDESAGWPGQFPKALKPQEQNELDDVPDDLPQLEL